VTCGDCLAREATDAGELPSIGTAGGSARREYERRKDGREKRIRDEHPWIGGLILALNEDPRNIRAFGIGAAGETELGGADHRGGGVRARAVPADLARRCRPRNVGSAPCSSWAAFRA
jgi:hypothetical protein